jgi:twinkle protein
VIARYKDCNECLMARVGEQEMRACLEGAMDFAPEKVVAAEAFREAFVEEWLERSAEGGLQLPWEFPFRIRRGEMTVWTGIEKSGKSTVLGFVQVCLMAQGERCLLASFEVPPVKSLKKLSRQVYGGLLVDKRVMDRIQGESPSSNIQSPENDQGPTSRETMISNYRAECRRNALEAFDWLAGRLPGSYPDGATDAGISPKLWIYNHVGIGRWEELLEDIRWARRRHGITQFVVDNFMRLGIVKDDYAQQAEAITAFAAAAIELDCHIHMVVHQNKQEARPGHGSSGSGGKRTVSGAYEIIANAHNIVEVQRDVKKGEKVAELFEQLKVGAVSDTDFANQKRAWDLVADGKFILHAAREGEVQNGSKYLWFLWESQQYADRPPGHESHSPIRFLKMREKAGEREWEELPSNEELGL